MRGISIETLAGLRGIPNQDSVTIRTLDWLINVHCKELQEPWMTLDEFFISGFDGECWICLDKEEVYRATYLGKENGFRNIHGHFFRWGSKHITHVMPIHKPEPPG